MVKLWDEMTEQPSQRCACKSHDRYDCWALRYFHRTDVSGMTIDEDGGPCECLCHDEWEATPKMDEWL